MCCIKGAERIAVELVQIRICMIRAIFPWRDSSHWVAGSRKLTVGFHKECGRTSERRVFQLTSSGYLRTLSWRQSSPNVPGICTPCPRPVPADPQLSPSPHRPTERRVPRSLCCQPSAWVSVSSGLPDSRCPTFQLGPWLSPLLTDLDWRNYQRLTRTGNLAYSTHVRKILLPSPFTIKWWDG